MKRSTRGPRRMHPAVTAGMRLATAATLTTAMMASPLLQTAAYAVEINAAGGVPPR